jgi:muramoyltetrapeptide carboxypeptidase
MPINFPETGTERAIESLRKALFGETIEYQIDAHPLSQPGNAAGILTGGNLSILYSLTGSPSDIQTDEKILFIEDIDEYLYHIDRMMENLKRNGKLKGIRALLVGGMTKMNDNTIPFGKQAEQIISEYAREAGIPVCFGFPAGHMADNRALIMGREVRLNIGSNGATLQFLTSGENTKASGLLTKILKPALFFLGFFIFIYLVLFLIRQFIK